MDRASLLQQPLLPRDDIEAQDVGNTGAGERCVTPEAAARAAQTQEAYENLALFNSQQEEEDDDDDDEAEPHWYHSGRAVWIVSVHIFSILVFACGIAFQGYPVWSKYGIFRWMFFFGSWLPAYSMLQWITSRAFYVIELYYFKDSLAYLDSLKNASIALAFAVVQMLLFKTIFEILCGREAGSACEDEIDQTMVMFGNRVLLCSILFSLASWISSLVAKVISTHFYKTTHFKKIQTAVEKEYYLQALSAPKSKVTKKTKRNPGLLGISEDPMASQFRRRDTPAFSHLASTSNRGSVEGLSKRFSDTDSPYGSVSGQSLNRTLSEPDMKSMLTDQDTSGHVRTVHLDRPIRDEQSAGLIPESVEVPQLPEQIILGLPTPGNDEGFDDVRDKSKLERLRTTVVIRTYSKLINHYKHATAETEKRMMKDVKAFARALFKNIAGSSRRAYVTESDFAPFFEDDSEQDVLSAKAFCFFDANEDKRVTKQEVHDAVLAIFQARANVAGSLVDTDSIVQSLEHGFAGIMHFLFIGLYLLIWDINVVAGFATFSATLVGLSFVFGNSIRTMFESLLFLFSQHPYDVGDWVKISGEIYQIKTVRLLHTMMQNVAGHPVYFSNADLLTKQIDNWSRSSSQTDYNYIEVDMGIASDVKTTMRKRLHDHVVAHPSDYVGGAKVFLQTLREAGLKAVLQIQFTINCAADDFQKRDECRDSVYQIISDTVAEYRGKGLQHTNALVEMRSAVDGDTAAAIANAYLSQ